MIKKILAALAGLGAFFSALFFVLFKQAKTEQKLMKVEDEKEEAQKKVETLETVREAEKAVAQTAVELEKEDEELLQRSNAGNNLSSFSAGLDLLRKQSERGNKRNTSAGSSGA